MARFSWRKCGEKGGGRDGCEPRGEEWDEMSTNLFLALSGATIGALVVDGHILNVCGVLERGEGMG